MSKNKNPHEVNKYKELTTTNNNNSSNSNSKEKLFNNNFIFVCVAHFFLFFAFYLLLPVLPLYLIETFKTDKALTGFILSSYTISALVIRPFSGFIADTLPRKPLYVICYLVFASYFLGYILAGTLLVLTVVRATHGLSFGMVSTASSTIAIDVMPSSRRGEGVGYFGIMGTIAMALGPMTGLFLKDSFSFETVFATSFVSGVLGLFFASSVKPTKIKISSRTKKKLSLDRFILLKGMPAFLTVFLIAFTYGLIVTYIALYGREIGITTGTGAFFTLMSVGLILSRLRSGKLIDRGYLTQMILFGKILLIASIFIFVFFNNYYTFFGTALFIGLAFGIMAPSYQTLFINLASHEQRGTANSTYLTSWDLGISAGVLLGGQIAQYSSYYLAYMSGLILLVISFFVFWKYTSIYFLKNKLR